MTTFRLKYRSIRMEEHRPFDWTETRYFDFGDVYLESGALELETGEVLRRVFRKEPLNNFSKPAISFDRARRTGKLNAILAKGR